MVVKKLLTRLIIGILITSVIPISLKAVNDNGNTGWGQTTSGTNKDYTWNSNQEGYRIVIVDSKGKQVSNTLDILFSSPSTAGLGWGNNYYTNSRVNTLSTDRTNHKAILIGDLRKKGKEVVGSLPPKPIYYIGNKALPSGQEFKQWFYAGIDTKPNSQATNTSGGGSNPIATGPTSGGVTIGGTGNRSILNPTDLPSPNNDLLPKSQFMIFADPVYRGQSLSEAQIIVISQNLYKHANALMSARITILMQTLKYMELKSKKTWGELVGRELAREWAYCESVGKTNAEAVYLYATIINQIAGEDYQPNITEIQFIQNRTGVKLATNNKTTAEKNLKLEGIPLAANYNAKDGYADEILNYIDPNGKQAFSFKQEVLDTMPDKADVIKGNKKVTTVMEQYNYSVIVEPVFWFRPAQYSSNGPINSHPNYVYGTVSNIIEFYHNMNYKFGTFGGAYPVLMGDLGWSCMYISKEWRGDNGNILAKPISGLGTRPNLSTLYNNLKGNMGFGIHVYTVTPPKSDVQYTGRANWTNPGAAENPASLQPKVGYTKKYNIVKYYEEIYTDGSPTVKYGPYVTKSNPPDIQMVNESAMGYKVVDWFVTKDSLSTDWLNINVAGQPNNPPYIHWQEVKSNFNKSRTGASADKIQLEQNKQVAGSPQIGEETLFLLLRKTVNNVVSASGPLVLGESEITKSITTLDSTITNWGPRTFTFNYSSMSGSDVHYCSGCKEGINPDGTPNIYCPGHGCSAEVKDSTYKYIIENSSTLDSKLEANAAGGSFTSKMVNNELSGSASLNGGTNVLNTAEYRTTIWRGEDIPTIASYKESSTIDLISLINRYGIEPAGDRSNDDFYTKTLTAQLSVSAKSDLTTSSKHGYSGSTWYTSSHSATAVAAYTGDVTVRVYAGDPNNKEIGDSTVTDEILTNVPFGTSTSIHSAGYMIQEITPIVFYPYIRMTYMTTGSNVKKDVNILSQHHSEILPNSFAEAAWVNPNESESLTMSSTQWSLHAKAVNGGQSWNGRNKVLPGGAMYQLSTKQYTSKVALVTWQPIVLDPERSALYYKLPKNEYTLGKANTEHSTYVEEAKQTLEGLRIVQWVNKNPNATNAWTGTGAVKITSGGQSLSALGLTNKTSFEAKYRLGLDGSADAGNEGDLDVVSQTNSQDTYYKVFADTSGNIYLAKAVGSIDSLKNVRGDNLSAPSGVTVTPILNKSDNVGVIDAKLTGDAKDLNLRTLIITNFVKSLERNTGSDNGAAWAADGRWYNEAFDGIYVVRKSTTLEVGLGNPGLRTAVLDVKIIPENNGKADMFSKAFLSQFRVNEKSDIEMAEGKPNGFLATFMGKDIILKDMTKLYTSKKFYIPNVSVTDLN